MNIAEVKLERVSKSRNCVLHTVTLCLCWSACISDRKFVTQAQGSYGPWKSWKTLEIFEVLEMPGNPWKSPGIFLLSPGKSQITLLKKYIREMLYFVDFV